MTYGWTPNEIAEMSLGQILAAIGDRKPLTTADAVGATRRWRQLRRLGLQGLLE